MNDNADMLPADVQAAVQRGDALQAIKLLRAQTGMDLQQAKARIDAQMVGSPVSMASVATGALPMAVMDAVRQGNKVEAIRLLREQTGLGLKEAKDAVDAAAREAQAAGHGSPGQVGAGRNALWWVVAALLVAAGVYFLRT